MDTTGKCLSENDLLEYWRGRGAIDARRRIREHLEYCGACQKLAASVRVRHPSLGDLDEQSVTEPDDRRRKKKRLGGSGASAGAKGLSAKQWLALGAGILMGAAAGVAGFLLLR